MKKFTKLFVSVMMLLLLPAVVVQAQFRIYGHVYYGHTNTKPLSCTKIILKFEGDTYSCFSDPTGYYQFSNLPPGTYEIIGEYTLATGGISTIDITLAKRVILGLQSFTELQKRAADANKSGGLTTIDPSLLVRHIIPPIPPSYINPYEMVWDGQFEPGWHGGTPAWEQKGRLITINSDYSHDVRCLCSGDVNGSYNPPFLQCDCGYVLFDIRDNQDYRTVQIGTQCWMAENLNIGTMLNGSTGQTDNSSIEKYCYDNSTANCDVYGGLYQWDEAMEYNPSTSGPDVEQGICPAGWHLPTDDEWCTLEHFIEPPIPCDRTWFSGEYAGGDLKETGTIHWQSPNLGATNATGFTALPGGYRTEDGSFSYFPSFAFFWSSNEYDAEWSWNRALYYNYASIRRAGDAKTRGYSVRCLKDQ